MNYQIDGVIAQTLRLEFRHGETCWASKGSLVSLDEGIDWRLRIPGGAAGALKRSFSGEGFALSFLESNRDGAAAVLGANQAGRITAWHLTEEGTVLATRGAFLAAIGNVDISVTIARRAGAALFGGAGLILQHLSGTGTVFIHSSGDYLDKQLDPGQRMLVSTGNLAAFAEQVDYSIRGVGGCRKILFGGEGIFMTELVGPGRVLLQSLKRGIANSGGG